MNGTTRFVVLVLPIALASGCVTTGSAPAPTAVAATPSPPATTSDSAPPAAADPARLLDLGRALLARGEMVAATMALREALHLKVDPRLDILGGDGQHEGALQALVLGLDGLDGHVRLS